MNYLTRLAAQSGLFPEPPRAPAHPVGIEEIEVVTPAPVALEETQSVRRVDVVPDPPQPAADVVQADTLGADPVQVVPEPKANPVTASFEIAAPEQEVAQTDAPPVDIPDPEVTREILLQRVMRWVASNEPVPALPIDTSAPAVPAERPIDHADDTPVSLPVPDTAPRVEPEIPSLEIGAADEPPLPQVQAATLHERAGPTEPASAPPPARQSFEMPAPSALEERIEISIGTIHLDVSPPHPPRTPQFPAPPAPVSPPAPARHVNSSRLARRFIRM